MPHLPIVRHSPEPLTPRDWRWAVGVALVAGLLRVLFADQRGFWLDEYYTLRAAEMGFLDLVADRLRAGHSPLYFLYAKLGLLLGQEERLLRVTSALAVSATVLLGTGLMGALGLRRHLVAFWVLAAAQPYWFTAGIEFRYMMPLIAVATATAWAVVRYVHRRDRDSGVWLAALSALFLAIHASALFVLAGFGMYLVWEEHRRLGRFTFRVFAPAWPLVLGVLVVIPGCFLIRSNQPIGERKWPGFGANLRDICEVTLGNYKLWPALLAASWKLIGIPQLVILGIGVWRARRVLQREGQGPGWRFLMTWLLGVPLTAMLITLLARDVEGPARYLCSISVASTVLLAVAWTRLGSPRATAGYRIALGVLLAVQASATALDRGDLHREAVEWVLSHRNAGEPVVVSGMSINSYAFRYLGMSDPSALVGLSGRERKPEVVEEALQRAFGPRSLGFIFLYHSRAPVGPAVASLNQSGFFAEVRRFPVGSSVTVLAVIRDMGQRPWLDSLRPLRMKWGPSSKGAATAPPTQ